MVERMAFGVLVSPQKCAQCDVLSLHYTCETRNNTGFSDTDVED